LRKSKDNVTQEGQWHKIDWTKVNAEVTKLRERIFVASRENDLRKVGNLQKLMLRSEANKLSAIRRVTQINRGRRTAGVDQEVITTPQERWELFEWLNGYNIKNWSPPPTRRVEIPKNNGKKRPLGIPTIKDRCIQAVVKNALEPFWEARFEESSYGFRPGRSAHDAAEAIWTATRHPSKREWIVDADIKGAFDNIDHEFLMKAIGNFPGRELIRRWLRAGVMKNLDFEPTITGTPQGGIISPLLANITLHGMESAFGVKRARGYLAGGNAVIRYADDFVIIVQHKEEAEAALGKAKEWLSKRGLEISSEKTTIRHIDEGFDFLGFTFKRIKNNRRKIGTSVYVMPSRKAITRFKARIKAEITKGRSPGPILASINPIIRGWGNYYKSAVSAKTFHKLDDYIWQRLWRYAKSRHPNKGKKWIADKYFEMDGKRRWVFKGQNQKGNVEHIFHMSTIPTTRHIKVRFLASPDDPELHVYWEKRMSKSEQFQGVKDKLWKRQKGRCTVCNDWLDRGEEIVLHHRDRNRNNNRYSNLEVLHEGCHHKVHHQPETA